MAPLAELDANIPSKKSPVKVRLEEHLPGSVSYWNTFGARLCVVELKAPFCGSVYCAC
jgi:hypothetical protein